MVDVTLAVGCFAVAGQAGAATRVRVEAVAVLLGVHGMALAEVMV